MHRISTICALLIGCCAWEIQAENGDCEATAGTVPCPKTSETSPENEEKTRDQLLQLRTRIDDVRKTLAESAQQSEGLRTQLEENEIAAAGILEKRRKLDRQVADQLTHLAQLANQKEEFKKKTAHERRTLSRLLYSSMLIKRNEYLKLLLRQEDAAMLGRMMVWHGYHSRLRERRVAELQSKLNGLRQVHEEFTRRSTELQNLRKQQEEKARYYQKFRQSREEIIAKLDARIHVQGKELDLLLENEKRLKSLLGEMLNRIQKDPSDEIRYAKLPAFSSLRGELEWPVLGKLLHRFNQVRHAESELRWSGVLLSATAGDEVRSIGHGKVVHADWLRGLGWLIVINHGEGYMSLYGHNQQLLKKAGDWVLAGEPIAIVGDSGGQNKPGVYFEIRHKTRALNPTLWCKDSHE
ncbi:MAG: murein hydrolase activator EnvC family protein [Candidatus Eutrophobiaceae bacterium]